eukprot:TRINITY_DN3172_c0_g1_i2.p1 TRINITY_DN3172_c0_g1~~TRINITY_DN3172_c0_g1_i2.p1  ORF type:complete len:153 (+),score=26.49 TRINITY_DN3172_c0_g1_i2:34-492(+)
MSLLNLVGSSFGRCLTPSNIIQISVRDASKKAGGSTRNRCKNTPGKMRGIKVYDGQRVPEGKMLVSQYRLAVLPGWNAVTQTSETTNIFARCHGRVMLTTEKVEPKNEEYLKISESKRGGMQDYMLQENIYRLHVHVIPDEPHQYFKLVEQI